MKTHSATQPGRPRGPAPGRSLLPRCLAALAAFFLAGPAAAQVLISQAIPAEDNSTYFDHNNDTPAVIILKNNGTGTATISGLGLSDNSALPLKWVIPGGTFAYTLAPGATMVFFASGLNRTTPPFATNFLLPCGSTAYLANPQGIIISQKAVAGEECPECIPLISPQSTSAVLVPTVNNPPSTGPDWRGLVFSDSGWPRGQACIGYETDPITAGMILYAAFDNGTVNLGTRAITDLSGPAVLHTGSWPNIAPIPINIPASAPAQILQSVGFAGPTNTNSYVFYNHHAELNPGTASYTFSIWVRPTNTDNQTAEVIFRKGGTNITDPGYSLTRLANAGGARFRIQTSTANFDAVFSGANQFPANAWTHLGVVIERTASLNQARLYRNGTQMNLVNFAAATSVASPSAQLVQALGGGGLAMFQGFQDDFATWGRALTNTELTQVYQAGLAGKLVDDPSATGGAGAIVTPCIRTDVQSVMKGINTSIYERINFNLPTASLVNTMTLSMKYTDGFIAYINGVEIARRNAPSGVSAWNSAATADRSAAQAIIAEDIPVPAAGINALVNGTNVLAIHGLTKTVNDPYFLICPELCYDERGPEDCNVSTNGKHFWITFPGNAPEDLPNNPLPASRRPSARTSPSPSAANLKLPSPSPPASKPATPLRIKVSASSPAPTSPSSARPA